MNRYAPIPVAPPRRQKPMLRRTAVLVVLGALVWFSSFALGPSASAQEPEGTSGVDSSSIDGSPSTAVDALGDDGLPTGGPGSSSADDSTVDGSATDDSAIVENPLRDQDDEEPGTSTDQERKVWAVIGGLLLVALALTIITVRYWRQTKPSQAPPPSLNEARGRRTGRRQSGGRRAGGRRARQADQPSPVDDLGTDIFVDET